LCYDSGDQAESYQEKANFKGILLSRPCSHSPLREQGRPSALTTRAVAKVFKILYSDPVSCVAVTLAIDRFIGLPFLQKHYRKRTSINSIGEPVATHRTL
jgi:hypothetical protein